MGSSVSQAFSLSSFTSSPLRTCRPGYREYWAVAREQYAPSFRAEIDRIVAEVGGKGGLSNHRQHPTKGENPTGTRLERRLPSDFQTNDVCPKGRGRLRTRFDF